MLQKLAVAAVGIHALEGVWAATQAPKYSFSPLGAFFKVCGGGLVRVVVICCDDAMGEGKARVGCQRGVCRAHRCGVRVGVWRVARWKLGAGCAAKVALRRVASLG